METKLEIRAPRAEELPLLSALWQNVFEDTAEYIEEFFCAAEPCHTALCAFDSGTLAGMLFLLPSVLTLHGVGYEARYVYSVATAPQFRNRGVFRQLHAAAEQQAAQEGARCLVLVPAGNALFSMYAKFGYRTRFYLCETLVSPMTSPQAALSWCKPEEFLPRRRELLRYLDASFDFYPALCEFRYYNQAGPDGELFFVRTPCGDGYVAGESRGDTYRIAETSLTGLALSHAAGALCQARHARRVTVRGRAGVRLPYAMIRLLDESIDGGTLYKADAYMNLMLT